MHRSELVMQKSSSTERALHSKSANAETAEGKEKKSTAAAAAGKLIAKKLGRKKNGSQVRVLVTETQSGSPKEGGEESERDKPAWLFKSGKTRPRSKLQEEEDTPKLADAEERMAQEIRVKQEKREKYRLIIEENESQLKDLSRQIEEMKETIQDKEGKIAEMKRQKSEKPLLRRLSSQLNIAKSVLKKEKLEDELTMLRSQSATRRKQIQKYKTKIRYDLQIMDDPSITAVKPSNHHQHHHHQESRSRHTQPPIPSCFFVTMRSPSLSEESNQEQQQQQLQQWQQQQQQQQKRQQVVAKSNILSTTVDWVKEQIALRETANESTGATGSIANAASPKDTTDWVKQQSTIVETVLLCESPLAKQQGRGGASAGSEKLDSSRWSLSSVDMERVSQLLAQEATGDQVNVGKSHGPSLQPRGRAAGYVVPTTTSKGSPAGGSGRGGGEVYIQDLEDIDV